MSSDLVCSITMKQNIRFPNSPLLEQSEGDKETVCTLCDLRTKSKNNYNVMNYIKS